MTHVTPDDEGKRVVYGDEAVGRVVEVADGTAYVDPDPGIAETIEAKLGWAEADSESVVLDESDVADVTGDEVRLRDEL